MINTVTVSGAGSYRVDGFAYLGAASPTTVTCHLQEQDVPSGVFQIMDTFVLTGPSAGGLASGQEIREPYSGAFTSTGATPVQVVCQTPGGVDTAVAVRLTVEQVSPLVASNS